MARRSKTARARLLCGSALASVTLWASAAAAQETEINIPAQSLATALYTFAGQSGHQVMFSPDLTGAKTTAGVTGVADREQALRQLLAGSGLTYQREDDTFLIVRADGPQSGSAAGDGAEGTVDTLVVTAQKREEDIQDVPIAISAFTQEALETHQIAGGPDLMTQVPNMTFTKTNFSSYSIQLRGIGTQAISATTDPAVAVAFNNTPFVRNRFFEQEFYDLERVEVLRGPQGTLYGRNATAGVVNIISAKPKFAYEARLSGDIANYSSTRVEGMVNVPLVDDVVALRLAGAWTKREGFVTNEITGNPIDGRDLWSTRLSLRFAPTESLDVNLIWEHFEEDDDRLRSGKQVCHRDARTELGGLSYTYGPYNGLHEGGLVNQGCLPASVYSPDSYEAPNGFSLPFYHPLGILGIPLRTHQGTIFDPYASTTQSRDLRVIESTVDPHYQAETDVVELQFSYDLGGGLTLSSETAYNVDDLFSTQDYNRFNTQPGAFDQEWWDQRQFNRREGLLEDGFFCDPQIGCANRLVAVDLSTSQSRQFSQEFRLGSDFDGAFNFSLGANFLRHDTLDKYYVFINTLSLFAAHGPYTGTGINLPGYDPMPPYVVNVSDNRFCLPQGFAPPTFTDPQFVGGCQYIDPNPIGALNDLGHNYFLSKNPYKLISYAVFGEAYYNITDTLKLTAGLRWTVDKKEAPRIPSWLLAMETVGLPVLEVVEQEWREPTGRFTADWKPDLAFTDETLLYASYSRGYKAGGSNPPPAGTVVWMADATADALLGQTATAPRTFDAEFVNAYEVGSKNTLLDGRLTLNLGAFYYDYENYQISYIVNRSAVNLNFDTEVWGLEIEADWRPLENLRFGFKGGYENTRVADGESAIDVMDRANGGMPDENGISWIVTRPFPTFPSNCIVPLYTVDAGGGHLGFPQNVNEGGNVGYCEEAYVLGHDPATRQPYQGPVPITGNPNYIGFDPTTAPNNGEGFSKDLSGNELPNAPHYTATITADYTVPLPNDWFATLHTDLYYQSEAWTRIFNMEGYDKLKAYTNVNVAAIFTNDAAGWKVMAYVKNVMDRDSITGAFLNSDDSGLTTNVFLTEPRLYGLRVTKDFSGGPWWTGANPASTGPFPLTIELSGQVQRQDAPYDKFTPEALADLPASLDTTTDLQNRDLDWGDGRSLRLIYRPSGSPWNVSAAIRYGRTNTDTARVQAQYDTVHEVCGMPPKYAPIFCDPAAPTYSYNFARFTATSSSDGAVRDREEHSIIDFQVGYDVGVGGLSRSEVGAGLRYADLQSDSSLTGHAKANWDVDEGWAKYQDIEFTAYHSDIDVRREFTGSGPVLSWAAALRLFEADNAGHLDFDWNVAAGALFGKQETEVTGHEYISDYIGIPDEPPLPESTTPIDPSRSRSQSVTVPLLDLSAGLSYEVGRIKVGAGYRWERYFDVLDVGYGEAKDGDRTIDGPYFKLSVGFGG